MVRRRLDDARYHLAGGFMTILPMKFDDYRLLLSFDRTGGHALNWKYFMEEVDRLYKAFHESFSYRGHDYMYQQYPLLSICFPDLLLETKGKEVPYTPVVFPGEVFDEPIPLEENCHDYIHAMDIDDYNKRQVRFFFIALVWGYNELKRAILQADAAISNAEFEVELQRFAASPNSAVVPIRKAHDDIHQYFKTGTGVDARSKPFWREQIQRGLDFEMQMRIQHEAAQREAARREAAAQRGGWNVGSAGRGQHAGMAGRGGMPALHDARHGGVQMLVQGNTFLGAGTQMGTQANAQGQHQATEPHQQQGNAMIDWHHAHADHRPLQFDKEEVFEDLFDVIDAELAVGVLPNVPIPVPAHASVKKKASFQGKKRLPIHLH